MRTKFARVSIQTPTQQTEPRLRAGSQTVWPMPDPRPPLAANHGELALHAEIGLQPRVVRGQHVLDRPDGDDLPVLHYGDAVAGRMQTVQIMSYHENGQA